MRTIALTFDDGPSEWTAPILDSLHVAGAKATFFVLGAHIAFHESLLEKMLRDGHEIGNHGWSHARMDNGSDGWVIDELAVTQYRVQAAVHTLPVLWRAPHLSASLDTIRVVSAKLGLAHVGFDVDPGDYANDADRIVDVVAGAPDGSIVDLHDGIPPDGGTGHPDREQTVEATRRILALPDTRFVTVSELWASTQAA